MIKRFVLLFIFVFAISLFYFTYNILEASDKQIDEIDFNQSSYPEIPLSEIKEFEIGKFSVKIISPHFIFTNNKMDDGTYMAEIFILGEIAGEKVLVNLGSTPHVKNIKQVVVEYIMKNFILEGYFLNFLPKVIDNSSIREEKLFGTSDPVFFTKSQLWRIKNMKDFEKFWNKKIDHPFLLAMIRDPAGFFTKSNFIPQTIQQHQ